MKQPIIFLFFCLAFSSTSAQVYNYPFVTPSGHTLYFNIDNGEAEVTFKSYNYPNYGNLIDSTLIIPDSILYQGVKYPVTTIGYQAFAYAEMQHVVIPNTVHTIGMWAFGPCQYLTEVVIPNSVVEIGQGAFGGCHNIASVTLPDSITSIASQTFDADTSLVSIVIPDAVTTIGAGAFSQCYSLRSVTFGHSVNSIANGAFSHGKHLDSLIFTSNVAPWISDIFYSDTLHLVIDIPCGSYHSYYPKFGSNHTYIVPSVNLSMNVSSLTPDWGAAIVVLDDDQQDVRCDSSAVIQAIANYGYHFTGWSNGSIANPDTLMIDRDSILTAGFAKNSYTVEVLSSDPTIGSVSGSGTFEYLDTIILAATAVNPYHFVRWSDGNTQNPRQFVVTGNAVKTAIFGIDTFSVTLQVDSVTHGTCTGFGNYPYGSAASVVAVPYSGYQFSHWSDGSTFNPYTFAVVDNVQLTAFFYANGTPYQDTLVVHDTVYIDVPVHDTTYITLTDTLYLTTTDTLWLHDTIYLPQYIHDTIYITQEGIDNPNAQKTKVYSSHGQIVVEGADGNMVTFYDVNGRMLAAKRDEYNPLYFDAPASGTYLIKIGAYPARRVVVIR
jgi:hypothetical protein